MFIFKKKVRFSEVDAAGIVFFARAFEYFHMAYEDFMVSMGLDLHEQFVKTGTALPVVRAEADYKQAMKLGETLTIHVAVASVGSRSCSIRYKIEGPEGSVRVTGISKHVFVNENFHSAGIPAYMRQKLKERENRDL